MALRGDSKSEELDPIYNSATVSTNIDWRKSGFDELNSDSRGYIDAPLFASSSLHSRIIFPFGSEMISWKKNETSNIYRNNYISLYVYTKSLYTNCKED